MNIIQSREIGDNTMYYNWCVMDNVFSSFFGEHYANAKAIIERYQYSEPVGKPRYIDKDDKYYYFYIIDEHYKLMELLVVVDFNETKVTYAKEQRVIIPNIMNTNHCNKIIKILKQEFGGDSSLTFDEENRILFHMLINEK